MTLGLLAGGAPSWAADGEVEGGAALAAAIEATEDEDEREDLEERVEDLSRAEQAALIAWAAARREEQRAGTGNGWTRVGRALALVGTPAAVRELVAAAEGLADAPENPFSTNPAEEAIELLGREVPPSLAAAPLTRGLLASDPAVHRLYEVALGRSLGRADDDAFELRATLAQVDQTLGREARRAQVTGARNGPAWRAAEERVIGLVRRAVARTDHPGVYAERAVGGHLLLATGLATGVSERAARWRDAARAALSAERERDPAAWSGEGYAPDDLLPEALAAERVELEGALFEVSLREDADARLLTAVFRSVTTVRATLTKAWLDVLAPELRAADGHPELAAAARQALETLAGAPRPPSPTVKAWTLWWARQTQEEVE